ncbi:phage integrase SAM-like domain-containing protein [Segetibacter koreensis]|uniref:phage integrase SAM-like domain-containing protein n=1 Tax=Segetibacter koreensis TaxID=398037 RepID=UPI000378D3EF|nr:phage integrase SAM-like domain-containing protein [Segetibacter koreensis]
MLLPIKAICAPQKIRRDGTSTIFLQYCFSATNRTLLNTGINIPPEYWHNKSQSITKKLPGVYGNFELLNRELVRLIRIAEDLVDLATKKQVSDRGSFVKRYFSPSFSFEKIEEDEEDVIQQKAFEQKLKTDIYFQLDDYVKAKERKVSKATLCVYKNVKAHLLAFEKYRREKITFQSLDFAFYEDFLSYLTFEHIHMRRQTTLIGLKLNTIGKTIKHLRVFIKDRVKYP